MFLFSSLKERALEEKEKYKKKRLEFKKLREEARKNMLKAKGSNFGIIQQGLQIDRKNKNILENENKNEKNHEKSVIR